MIKKYILASLNIYLLIITSLIYILGLITINIYPTSTNYIVTILLAIATTVTLVCYLNKKKSIYNLGIILTFIFNTITIYNIIELNTNYEYLNNIVTNKYEYKTYDVYVQKKNTKYNEIEKLSNKKIGMLKDNSTNICLLLNKKIEIECKYYDNLEELQNAIQNGEIQSFILSDNQKSKLQKSNLDIKNQTRIIYSTKIKDTKY